MVERPSARATATRAKGKLTQSPTAASIGRQLGVHLSDAREGEEWACEGVRSGRVNSRQHSEASVARRKSGKGTDEPGGTRTCLAVRLTEVWVASFLSLCASSQISRSTFPG
jgi:hypothetical protein